MTMTLAMTMTMTMTMTMAMAMTMTACSCRSVRTLNPNVRLIILFGFLRSVYSSLFNQTPISYYVLLTTGSETKVGAVQGLQGLVTLLIAFPAGALGDQWRRDTVLRGASVFGLLAIAATVVCLVVVEPQERRHLFAAVCVCMALWGCFMGGHSATVEALFGDSVESGRRSKLYAWKAAMRTAGNAVGPLVSILIFSLLSDRWTVANLTVVMLCGMAVAVVPCLLLCRLTERHTLGSLSESLLVPRKSRPSSQSGRGSESCGGRGGDGKVLSDLGLAHDLRQEKAAILQGDEDDGPRNRRKAHRRKEQETWSLLAFGRHQEEEEEEEENREGRTRVRHGAADSPATSAWGSVAAKQQPSGADGGNDDDDGMDQEERGVEGDDGSDDEVWEDGDDHPPLPGRGWLACGLQAPGIPALVAFSDFTSMLGSGMTVKFFPLFFGDELGVTPIGVNVIYLLAALGITAFSILSQKLAVRIGRVETCLVCRLVAVGLLVLLSIEQRVHIIVALYLVRTWLVNCISGLTKSILNDFASKANRAKWNSVESINLFSWSGSAALGGYLVAHIGYRRTFLITAAFQLLAAVLTVPLLAFVAREDFSKRPPTTPQSTEGEPQSSQKPGSPIPRPVPRTLAEGEVYLAVATSDDDAGRHPDETVRNGPDPRNGGAGAGESDTIVAAEAVRR